MIGNRRPSETMAIVATIDPQTIGNVAVVSDWVAMGTWESVAFAALIGNVPAETFDIGLQQATDASGTASKVLANATQIAANATVNDNTQLLLQARAEDLDFANGFTHVAIRILGAGPVGGPISAVGLGFNARYGVGTDLTTVSNITTA